MKRLALAFAAAVAVLALGAGPAGATNECRGLQVCISVAGPWVLVPTSGTPRPHVEFQLTCPRRFIVGGLDAELSDRAIDIQFDGRLGSPVNPGVTTSTSAVFRATYAGARKNGAPSFRPRLGCIPASGGGGGIPTARRVFPPGQPTARHVRTVDLRPGLQHVTQRCAAGERLVRAARAVGFYTAAPPAPRLGRSVKTSQKLLATAVVVAARAGSLDGTRAVVQVAAVCSGGR